MPVYISNYIGCVLDVLQLGGLLLTQRSCNDEFYAPCPRADSRAHERQRCGWRGRLCRLSGGRVRIHGGWRPPSALPALLPGTMAPYIFMQLLRAQTMIAVPLRLEHTC